MQKQKNSNEISESYIDGIAPIGRFPLKSSCELSEIEISYRLHGDPTKPVVIALGGISAHRGLTASAGNKRAWWPELVGSGLGIDTDRFCVLSFDYLGGSSDTTGPHHRSWPEHANISTDDQARLTHWLCESLNINHIHHWVGASYGGMVGLAYASLYPQNLDRLTVISAAHRSHPMAMAWRYIQREIVALGRKTGEHKRSLALARALAMTTYRSQEEFGERFNKFTEVTDYLEATGNRYAESTCDQSFTCLSSSIDEHLIDAKKLAVDLDIIGFWEDRLVPAEILQELAEHSGGRLQMFHSIYGHDAFLKEINLFNDLLTSQREFK